MPETNPNRLAAIKAGAADRKKRKRSASLHITVTPEEEAEFKDLARSQGLLDRELLMNSIRAYKNHGQRIALLEARLTLVEAKISGVDPYHPPAA